MIRRYKAFLLIIFSSISLFSAAQDSLSNLKVRASYILRQSDSAIMPPDSNLIARDSSVRASYMMPQSDAAMMPPDSNLITRDSSVRASNLMPRPLFDWDYIHSGFMDAKDQIIAPLRWNNVQWMTAATITSVEAILMFGDGDKNIQIFAQKYRNNTTNFLENNIGDPFGDGLYPAIIVGSAYIAGCIFHKDKPKRFAMLAVKSFVISAATTTVIKYIAERHRPYQDNPANPLNWNGPIGNTSTVSFPSGHTTVAFSLATMLALEYPKPIIIPILAYSAATLTAFGRINGNYHWGSDVLMGASIGYFTSMLVFNHNNWGKLQKRKKIPSP